MALHVNYFAQALGMSMQMDVILPEETHGQVGMEGGQRWQAQDPLAAARRQRRPHHLAAAHQYRALRRLPGHRGDHAQRPSVLLHRSWPAAGLLHPHRRRAAPHLPALLPRPRPGRIILSPGSTGGYGSMKIGLSRPENYACSSAAAARPGIALRRRAGFAQLSAADQRLRRRPGAALMGGEHDLFHLADQLLAKGQPVPASSMRGHRGRRPGELPRHPGLSGGKNGRPLRLHLPGVSWAHEWPFWDAHICEAPDWPDRAMSSRQKLEMGPPGPRNYPQKAAPIRGGFLRGKSGGRGGQQSLPQAHSCPGCARTGRPGFQRCALHARHPQDQHPGGPDHIAGAGVLVQEGRGRAVDRQPDGAAAAGVVQVQIP